MPHRAGGPVPAAARQGREKQMYGPDGERLVAGSIPVRFLPGVNGPAGVEVLMITTRGGQSLVFPKGGWESDETVETAAQRETMEEAGVRGELEAPALGAFPFHSNKAERLQTANKGRCIAHMFVLRVTEELRVWPEAAHRKRVWVPLCEAAVRARDAWMRDALAAWARSQGWADAMDQQPLCSASEAALVTPRQPAGLSVHTVMSPPAAQPPAAAVKT